MEVIIVSDVEVHVTVVSPYKSDVKKYINKYPFRSNIDELKRTSIKHGLEAAIEIPNPKCSVRVFQAERESCETVSIEKGNITRLQYEPVVILTDIATQMKSSQKNASKKPGEKENGNLQLQSEKLLDSATCSVNEEHVCLEQYGLQIDDITTRGSAAQVNQNITRLQSEPVVILTDIANQKKSSKNNASKKPGEKENGNLQLQSEESLESDTCSVNEEHVSLEQYGLPIDDITTMGSAAQVNHNLQNMNLVIDNTLIDIDTLCVSDVVPPTPVPANSTYNISEERHPEPYLVIDSNCSHTRNRCRGNKIRKSKRNKQKEIAMGNTDISVENNYVFDKDLTDILPVEDFSASYRTCKEDLEMSDPFDEALLRVTDEGTFSRALDNTISDNEDRYEHVFIDSVNGNNIMKPTRHKQKEKRADIHYSSVDCIVINNTNSIEKDSEHFPNIETKARNGDLSTNPDSREVFRCNICNKDFSSNECLQRHLSSQGHIDKEPLGGQKQPFKCDVCFKNFNTKGDLQKHKMIHTGTHGYTRIHTGEYACNYCNKRFTKKSNRKQHEMIHTGEKPYKCQLCDKKFRKHSTLKEHETIHTNKRTFMCGKCGKGFTCNGNLKQHMKSHTKLHICNICKNRFAQKRYLDRHSLTHSGLKPYACSICDFQTVYSQVLFRHMKRHTGEDEKRYSCDYCAKNFVRKDHLRRHLVIHEGGTTTRVGNV